MTKLEVFTYLNSGIDKSGNLKKIGGFRKHFSDLYNEFVNFNFPKNIEVLPFKQKLWHFLNDNYNIPTCKICHKPVSFLTKSGHWGYSTYCSGQCAMQDNEIKEKLNNTKLEQYGDSKYNNSKKQKETLLNKDETFWTERYKKSIKTRFEKNDGQYFSNDSIQKIKRTTLEKYGVDSYAKTKEFNDKIKSQHDDIQLKQYSTKFKNNSFNKSSIENQFGNFLSNLNIEYISQYKSNLYPFTCDFYIVPLDLYIEINGHWTHGSHPFDSTNIDDLNVLEKWKSKNTKFYNQAIYVWTDLDIRKRNISKENNLNYLEIFSDKLETCITQFNDYLSNMIIEYCLVQELPGTTKWVKEHPIWDCNVGNKLSPRQAWKDKTYITKAVKNLFNMVYRYDDIKRKFIKELVTCKIQNNNIVSSSQKFLELILNRFTIAKIAPKVTALSSKTLKSIIDESNIDISNGVYIPMSGFGGIVEGVKQWGIEHDKNIECECYDINPFFCKWYGWIEKDMLADIVITDKVCICCPPFGKEYEHWEGTSKNMSNKTFKEWYKLIKKHVISPHYIIIGPELKSKNKVGLFSKKVGVMLWTDDMIETDNV